MAFSIMQLEAQLRLFQNCLWCYRRVSWRLHSQSSAHRSNLNNYEILGVRPNANMEEIKRAFFDKSKKLHPDSDPSNPGLHSQFVQLNDAYRVLSKERSRKEYDLKLSRHYTASQAFTSTSSNSSYKPHSTDAQENIRYWEQFRQSRPQEMTPEEWQKRRRRNLHFVGYCVLIMVFGIGVHAVVFRKLGEIHSNFMDEKDRVITEVYNDAKERARVNGFKKQTEILRQKHAEYLEKHKLRGGEDK